MKKGILLSLLFIAAMPALFSQIVSLQLSDNEENGYNIQVLYGNKKVISNDATGEFNLIIENDDRSISDTLCNWKAKQAEENGGVIKLTGQYYQKDLMTYINVEVDYSIVNDNVIKKEISLEQNNIPLLFYQLENKLTPADEPVSYWSFDYFDAQNKPK